jgi:hypothetical protein
MHGYWTSPCIRSKLRKTRTSKSKLPSEETSVKTQLRAEIENDQLAYYKELYEKHGAGRTNLAYGYALRNS